MPQRVPRHRGGAPVAAGEPHIGGDGAVEVGDQGIEAVAQFEHQGGVDHVLRAGAPMHEAGRVLVLLGDLGGERRHQWNEDIAGGGRRGGDGREVETLDLAGTRVLTSGGLPPAAASARASAASKSSMRWRRARSSTIARMAALENMGISRGEGARGSDMARLWGGGR